MSDISGPTSSDSDDDDDDDEDDDDCEIEQPHRTLGIIFFDFVRCVAVSANCRCVSTQLMPLFLAWNKQDALSVALRIFITLFSLLLILVEFPGVFPFLQHETPSSTSSKAIGIAPPSASSSSLSSPSSSTMSRSTTSSFERLLPKQPAVSPPSSSSPAATVPPLYVVNWIPRGILYAFLGLVILEQSIVVLARDQARHASTTSRFLDGIFVVISGWVMIASGAMYVLLGMFCLQGVMERVRVEDGERWREYYERVDELENEMEGAKERELIAGGGLAKDSADEGEEVEWGRDREGG
ncbi:hypothetical protein ACHAXA_002529 [Cyclostephanos tholiformis]|uniref:Uncharacterized protein n=1 Tax=Cyclostephanos tholiformis TaxID=382380 RepID=A0ABD3RBF7_9STRA